MLPVVIVFPTFSVPASFSNSEIVEHHVNSVGLYILLRGSQDFNYAVARTPSVLECPSLGWQIAWQKVVWPKNLSGNGRVIRWPPHLRRCHLVPRSPSRLGSSPVTKPSQRPVCCKICSPPLLLRVRPCVDYFHVPYIKVKQYLPLPL